MSDLFKIVVTLTGGALLWKALDEKYGIQAKNTPFGDFEFFPPQPCQQPQVVYLLVPAQNCNTQQLQQPQGCKLVQVQDKDSLKPLF